MLAVVATYYFAKKRKSNLIIASVLLFFSKETASEQIAYNLALKYLPMIKSKQKQLIKQYLNKTIKEKR